MIIWLEGEWPDYYITGVVSLFWAKRNTFLADITFPNTYPLFLFPFPSKDCFSKAWPPFSYLLPWQLVDWAGAKANANMIVRVNMLLVLSTFRILIVIQGITSYIPNKTIGRMTHSWTSTHLKHNIFHYAGKDSMCTVACTYDAHIVSKAS